MIALCSVLLLTGLCGCTEKDLPLEEIVKKYTEAQRNIKSSSYTISAEMSLNDPSMSAPLDLDISSSMDIISNPISSKTEITINMSSLINLEMIIYSKQEGTEYNVYTGLKMGNNIIWQKETTTLPDVSSMAPFIASNSNVNIIDYELIGKEKIDGKNTYHLIASLSSEELIKLFDSFSFFDQLDADEELFEEVFSKLESLKMDLWIDTKDFRPVKGIMDGKTFINSLLGEESMHFDEALITIAYTDYNNINEIVIPQDALDAEPSEDILPDSFLG